MLDFLKVFGLAMLIFAVTGFVYGIISSAQWFEKYFPPKRRQFIGTILIIIILYVLLSHMGPYDPNDYTYP